MNQYVKIQHFYDKKAMKNKNFPYETTVNYEQMYSLITEGQTLIAILQDRDKIQRVCEVQQLYPLDSIDFITAGVSYLRVSQGEKMKELFELRCNFFDVQFIKPIF
jgi:hypothetical protein